MKVFEACLLIIKRRRGALALYFGLFMVLSFVMPALSVEQLSSDFTQIKPNFTIINRDADTPLSDGLAEYLGWHGAEVPVADRKEALQDAAFYHATDYIAILPEGFHASFFAGDPIKIETVYTTETAKGFYADSIVDQYFNQARMYMARMNMAAGTGTGLDEEAIVLAVLDDLSTQTKVEIKRFGAGAPVDEVFQIYLRLLCYIIFALVILCVSNIMSAFRRPDLRMRNLCAPTKPRSVGGQQILCSALMGFAVWLLAMGLGFAVFGSRLAGTDSRIIGLAMLNVFMVMLVALSIASLASLFIKSVNSQNAVVNFLSLGLSFLGGVFVPLSLLGDGMLAVARFTPTYWYVTALDHIYALSSFSADALAPVWQAMLTQLAFAAAFICVSLVVGKQLNQSERSFRSIQTEIDA